MTYSQYISQMSQNLFLLPAFQKSQANCFTRVTFVVKHEQLEDFWLPSAVVLCRIRDSGTGKGLNLYAC